MVSPKPPPEPTNTPPALSPYLQQAYLSFDLLMTATNGPLRRL